jgi:hypothetical protein
VERVENLEYLRIMNDEIEIIMSPLCQSFERDGITLQIEIYCSSESEWSLEVVNPSNTSIVWNDTFQSDKAALEEFLQTVKIDGVQSFLDDHSDGPAQPV